MSPHGWRRSAESAVSLADIEAMQPAGHPYEDHVDEAARLGIGLHDKAFELGVITISDMQEQWICTPKEWEDLDPDRRSSLTRAWRHGPLPPPMIVVRYRDGRVWGLDGYHRLNAAHRARHQVILAWIAQDVSPSGGAGSTAPPTSGTMVAGCALNCGPLLARRYLPSTT